MGFIPGLKNDFVAEEADLQTTDYRRTINNAELDQGLARNMQADFVRALQEQAAGRGPSLAQMQLDQSLGQLNRQAASALASTRGLNPAQQERLLLQQRAQNAQAMAGQAAMTRAQEQMAATQAGAQLASAMRGQDQQMFGTAGGLQNQQDQTAVANKAQANQINADVARQNTETTQMFVGAGLDAAGKALGAFGGGAPAFSGGLVRPDGVVPPQAFAAGGTVRFPEPPGFPSVPGRGGGDAAPAAGMDFATALRLGMVAPGGGAAPMPMNAGGAVPGPGAPVPGDHPANDTVPALLSPGEIVLPRSVAMDEDAPELAAEFVEALKREQGADDDKPMTFGELLQRQRELDAEAARLDALLGKAAK